MKTRSIQEVRRHFSDVVRAAQSGESTTITRYGEPVARIIPMATDRPIFPDMAEFRDSIKLRGKTLTDTLRDMREAERF